MHAILLIAALTTQSFTLSKGWNALLFEVTPTENAEPAQVFADTHITKALCYLPNAYDSTVSYDVDGAKVAAPPVSYRQWVRDDEMLTDMQSVQGGMIYLVYATEKDARIVLSGDPSLPHFHWRKATQQGEGFASYAAPSLDVEDKGKITAQKFFGEGPWNGRFQESYRLLGTRKMPVASPFPQSGYCLEPGRAYGFTAQRDVDWAGVVDVSGVSSEGVVFEDGATEVSFLIRNAGTTNRTISLTYKKAEGSGYLDVPISEFAESNRIDYELGAGESTFVTLHSDPTARTSPGQLEYAGILEARDETGGTRMRVRFPVRAERVSETAWPVGLYVGGFELSAVGLAGAEATRAGGTVKGNLMLAVDKDGYPTLLQRIVVGQTNGVMVFCQDLDELSEDVRKTFRRFSSVTLDPLQPKIPNLPRRPIAVGETATFGWNVAYDSPSNPYFHAWHPDHDGAEQLSDGTWRKVKSGDDFTNYQSASKPELFSVSNEVELAFGSVSWNTDETLSGDIRWKLHNLRANAEGPISCTGTFMLKRISAKEELK